MTPCRERGGGKDASFQARFHGHDVLEYESQTSFTNISSN